MRRPVYETVTVGAPLEAAATRLSSDPSIWLPGQVGPHEQGTVVRLEAPGELAGVGVKALVQVGPPTHELSGPSARPLAWRPLDPECPLLRLVGVLELSGLTPDVSRLALVAGLKPSVSVVEASSHYQVTEMILRTFLASIGDALAGHAPRGT
jgi:hypothetical protein